jgi:hypothetical protein
MFPFDMFVDEFMEQCDDIHWRPQSARICHVNWKFLNFFGFFDNLHEDAKVLLQKIGAYHQFAESGWGDFIDLGLFEREQSKHEGPVTHHVIASTNFTPHS